MMASRLIYQTERQRLVAQLKQCVSYLDIETVIETYAESESPHIELTLLSLLNHHDPDVRVISMKLLGQLDRNLGRIAARYLQCDTPRYIQHQATEYLGEIGTSKDVSSLIQMLRSKYWLNRICAVTSLAEIGGLSVQPILVEVMRHDAHPVVRRDAAIALAKGSDERIIQLLKAALEQEVDTLAKLGMWDSLYLLGEREYFSPLVNCCFDQDPVIRHFISNRLPTIVRAEDRERLCWLFKA